MPHKFSGPYPPVRFVLTFDDGPSPDTEDNSTEKILNTLADNAIQPHIKAIFFVQTRYHDAGGSEVGQRLMRRMVADGHVLAIHSGTARGHVNHRSMDPQELTTSLVDAKRDIMAIGAESPDLVRPPYWWFNDATLSVYEQTKTAMLLTDLRARDGAFWLFQAHPDDGGILKHDFEYFRKRLAAGYVPTVDGVIPVVVTFHDTKTYTANNLSKYLATLIRLARDAEFTVANPPYYADRSALLGAARARASNRATRADLAP